MKPNCPSSSWRVELSSQWNVLGPFPIHAREQYYLSPSFPLDLSEPIDWSKSWPSSYADHGSVVWSKVYLERVGDIQVSFPDIRWASLRATEGWAALQYHAVLRTQLTLYPPTEPKFLPNLLIQLNQASFFTIIPNSDEQSHAMPTPRWYHGNIYNLVDAIPQTVELPTEPSLSSPTTYDLFISGDYEIRLFGDPHTVGSEVPILRSTLSVEVEEPVEMVMRAENQDVTCDFVEGFAFGSAIGFGLRSVNGWWTVRRVTVFEPPPTSAFSLELLNEIQIAPSQTRIVPLTIDQRAPIGSRELRLFVDVECGSVKQVVTVVLPVKQLKRWDALQYEPIKGTYFFATRAPTHFLSLPPQFPADHKHCPAILALHGAGVDIVHQRFWADALPRQRNSWIVIPTGRTSWGLDWHGPSAQDAWACIDALAQILDQNSKWRTWGFMANKPVVVLGHSNGGQGAWYLASRFPDRVLAVVPAAGYIKSQSYVPLSLSRLAHYIDPILRTILESALTPDDNDLHLSNVADVPIYAIHGGDDTNVPVWHTREAVSVVKTWASNPNILYREDKGHGHWYSSVFRNEGVKSFLEQILQQPEKLAMPTRFTITATIPAESGALHGWRIEELAAPGRLARMQIENIGSQSVKVSTSNVYRFSLDRSRCPASSFVVDSTEIFVDECDTDNNTIRFEQVHSEMWKVVQQEDRAYIQQSGRLQLILTTMAPITFIIPTKEPSHELSLALRLAHDLQQLLRLDVYFLDEKEALAKLGQREHGPLASGNHVIIGNVAMRLVQHILSLKKTPFVSEDSNLILNGHLINLDKSESAVLFLHPPLGGFQGLLLFILSSSAAGLERAVRLFPVRTGVPTPDWILTDNNVDGLGAAGVRAAGVWGKRWSWNHLASWIA